MCVCVHDFSWFADESRLGQHSRVEWLDWSDERRVFESQIAGYHCPLRVERYSLIPAALVKRIALQSGVNEIMGEWSFTVDFTGNVPFQFRLSPDILLLERSNFHDFFFFFFFSTSTTITVVSLGGKKNSTRRMFCLNVSQGRLPSNSSGK